MEVKCCPCPLPQHCYVLKLSSPLRVFIVHIPDSEAACLSTVKNERCLDDRIQGEFTVNPMRRRTRHVYGTGHQSVVDLSCGSNGVWIKKMDHQAAATESLDLINPGQDSVSYCGMFVRILTGVSQLVIIC